MEKNKVSGVFRGVKEFKNYSMIFVYCLQKKIMEKIFIFDFLAREEILKLKNGVNYNFFCNLKLAKNGKKYFELKTLKDVFKMSVEELGVFKTFNKNKINKANNNFFSANMVYDACYSILKRDTKETDNNTIEIIYNYCFLAIEDLKNKNSYKESYWYAGKLEEISEVF